jgi:glycosyltransferase involved in cell wall biosynthesis
MYERAKSSSILKKFPIFLLPNPIDVNVFKPTSLENKQRFREKYKLGSNTTIFLFGAFGGKKSKIKGAIYLEKSLKLLKDKLTEEDVSNIVFIDFGGIIEERFLHGFRNISIGYIKDFHELSNLYSCVDCTVVSSLLEAFGQVAAESLSCKTPVICFNSSGLTDIVHDGKSGFYAEAFSVSSLADQLFRYIFISSKRKMAMGDYGRNHVEKNFSYNVIKDKFHEILLESKKLKKTKYEG